MFKNVWNQGARFDQYTVCNKRNCKTEHRVHAILNSRNWSRSQKFLDGGPKPEPEIWVPVSEP